MRATASAPPSAVLPTWLPPDSACCAAEASSLARKRDQWRRWGTHTLAVEPPAAGSTAAVAATTAATPAAGVSIHTSDSKRAVRRFTPDASMKEVYAFVECLDVPREEANGEQQQPPRPPNGCTHRYAFRLVRAIPWQVFEPHAGTVADGLWPRATTSSSASTTTTTLATTQVRMTGHGSGAVRPSRCEGWAERSFWPYN